MEEEFHDQEEAQVEGQDEPADAGVVRVSGEFYAGTGDDEDDDDLYETMEPSTPITVRVFLHTGATLAKQMRRGSTVVDLRKALEVDEGRLTYGSAVILQGVGLPAEDEETKRLADGDIVTFTGAVKGGLN